MAINTTVCGIKRAGEELTCGEPSPKKRRIASAMVSSSCGSIPSERVQIVDTNNVHDVAHQLVIKILDMTGSLLSIPGLINDENCSAVFSATSYNFANVELLLGGQNSLNEAIKWCNIGLSFADAPLITRSKLYCTLAGIYMKQADYVSADQTVKKALKLHPEDPHLQDFLVTQLRAMWVMHS